MYICENCLRRFDTPTEYMERIDSYGGEHHSACPYCGAPELYQREELFYGEKQDDPEQLLGR